MKDANEIVKKVIMESQNKKKENLTGKGDGMRYNQGKLRYDLVHPQAHADMVDVLTYGAMKYADRNWENGFSWSSVIASAKRHLSAIEAGEDYDRDPNCQGCIDGTCKNHSGRLHVANLACNVHFLNAFYYLFPQGDDRPRRFLKIPKIGLDIDGILADFTGSWHALYPEISPIPSSFYLDRKIKQRFVDMQANGTLDKFYMDIQPLLRPEDLPFEPHCYITSRPVSQELTEDWLDMYHFPCKKVYSVGLRTSKVEACKEAGVEIFVDDSYDNFVELNNAGIFTYLYSAPWNTRYEVGHMRINSLRELPVLR